MAEKKMNENNGFLSGERISQTKTRIIVKGRTKQGEPTVEQVKESGVDLEGYKEVTTEFLPTCPCGNVISAADHSLGTDPITGEILCGLCSRVRCAECGQPLAPDSRVESGDRIYCKRHARPHFIGKLIGFGILIAIAAVVAWILLF